MIRLLLNILWFIFGGFISGCLWLLGGALLAITIVGLVSGGVQVIASGIANDYAADGKIGRAHV